MTELTTAQLVRQIHDAPCKIALAIIGGGSRAIAELLEEPGGSRVLLEAVVPYSSSALRHWLGGPPEQFCSARTARAMAMAAWLRAGELAATGESKSGSTLVGVACTASLASDRPKHGEHRLHVAWQTDAVTVSHSLDLVKGQRSRRAEEQLTAGVILNAMAEACGVNGRLVLPLTGTEQIVTVRHEAPAAWRDLLRGDVQKVCHNTGSIAIGTANTAPSRRTIFSGAFNPLHLGHRRIVELATAILGTPVEFEISILNVDKPPLDFVEMQSRLAQFSETQPVWFTRAATFERKAELFEQTTFIVGADTIQRIADPRYYGGDPAAALASVTRTIDRGARFLVFGRSDGQRTLALNDITLPDILRSVSQEVPLEQFRIDISSTELRGLD